MSLKAIFISLLLLFTYAISMACDCVMMAPVTAYVPKSDYILVVKARDIQSTGDPEIDNYYPGVNAQIEVVGVIKGKSAPGDLLEFAPHSVSNCSLKFKKDHTYLVFAYKDGDNFAVYDCSWSGDITDKRVRKDIKELYRYMKRHK
ncbi:hypothetical protein CLV59_1011005 [Chitinophaga dinghuensis]|uniref:Tissue inhibitor of metalloproteinase n=1 Tax=Chitinophaga dinghuensis TaxID=1539050 RepID=A0A327WBV0_9BACT|nr:hypothetical protein [Chitinophaga dinghuensis]RAJ88237.1 hypothetical protein CLV59_1011005 [Chitinophaga dinghuensis]